MDADEIRRYCSCGAWLALATRPPTVDVAAIFDRIHQGDGHRPVTSTRAALTRRRDRQVSDRWRATQGWDEEFE